jgi:hypothetical protein
MLIRRKILLASLIGGGLMPLRELAAQVKFAPDHDGDDEWHRPQRRRPGRTFDEDLDERIEDPPDPRPTMPPPRLELRPPPPDRDEWHWRSGHWVRIGEGWRWVHGRWDH